MNLCSLNLSKKAGGRYREYGIDILRILLALLIVANHSIGHGIKTLAPRIISATF